MFHFSTVVQNPQPHRLFSPLPIFPSAATPRKLQSLRTLKFPRKWNLHSLSPSSQQDGDDDDSEEHVIGDCVVFEEGIFEDPVFHNALSSDNIDVNNKPKHKSKKKVAAVAAENLVPDKWREVQAEINITKKDRRKIAREIEFNSKVENRRRGLVPLRDMNLEEYKAYMDQKERPKTAHEIEVEKKRRGVVPLRDMNLDEYNAFREAKLAQLKPLVIDNPWSYADEEEEVPEGELSDDGPGGGERVEPKNPRWAVYGRGLEDVTEFFNSGNYDPTAAKTTEGRPKLFTKEEKVLLNKRMPDLAAATSDKWLPLHTLAACGEFYLLDALVKHNVDINAVDKDGLTALHKAIIGKKQAITNYLLRNSANPFVQDKDGATLMHYAVQTASTPTIKVLLLYNVDINLQDNDGWTPLHLAVQTQRTDVVRLLLIKDADKTLKNKDGLTPLDLCLYSGQSVRTYELIKLLKQPQRRVRNVGHMGLRNNTTFERFGLTNEE